MKRSGSWRVNAGFDLLWHSWGDEHVVYHCGSGDTHLLDAAATGLLRYLREARVATMDDLSLPVAAALGMPADEALEYTGNLLEELERLSLVEPNPR